MTNHNRPDFYGLITIQEKGQYKPIRKIAIWKQPPPKPNSKRPPYAGNVELNRQRYRIALWEKIEQ
ncbi:MAG: hypothetical protein ABSB89_05830 [Candidatus Bathyarchaeia archaeon]|jgi:hypothetical protein